MTHNFKIVLLHPRSKPGFNIWRCDKCDSEGIFKVKYTQREVNQTISAKLPCIPTESNNIVKLK